MSAEHRILLTRAGYDRIYDELERLRSVQRREVAARIRDSKQFGEFAENAEYEDAKTEQAFVEGKILDLKRIIQLSEILEPGDIPSDYVGIGSHVTVKDMDEDEEWEIMIVGSVESDPDENRISNESPIGEALMDKRVGEIAKIRIPDGVIRYRVEKISA